MRATTMMYPVAVTFALLATIFGAQGPTESVTLDTSANQCKVEGHSPTTARADFDIKITTPANTTADGPWAGIYFQELKRTIDDCMCEYEENNQTLDRVNCTSVITDLFEWKQVRKTELEFTDTFQFSGNSEAGEGKQKAFNKRFVASGHPNYGDLRGALQRTVQSRGEDFKKGPLTIRRQVLREPTAPGTSTPGPIIIISGSLFTSQLAPPDMSNFPSTGPNGNYVDEDEDHELKATWFCCVPHTTLRCETTPSP